MSEFVSDFVVVVGASAGGTEALTCLLSQLPADFPACVLIVRHLPGESSAARLCDELNRHSSLRCREAADGDPLIAGRVYLAPAGSHMLVDASKVSLARGARENRWRPAIDPLFRSAAVTHPGRTVGVILTGYLDDGTAGLSAIKRCGGVCVVQDPTDATFPDMPVNALAKIQVDHCIPVVAMGDLLEDLVTKAVNPDAQVPPDLATEAEISARVLIGPDRIDRLGDRTTQTCPDCGGTLWQTKDGVAHFRCHTGHVFSEGALLEAQREKIEETLWVALRMFEERRTLLEGLLRKGGGFDFESLNERIHQAEVHIARIREIFEESPRTSPPY